MFAQTHALKQFDGIGVQDLPCALARIDSEQDRNQSAHDMGIAVAGKGQYWPARPVRAHHGVEPDLARAALASLCADSDAHIVRGLIAILFAVYSGKSAREILNTDAVKLFEGMGLREHLTPQRSNGFRSMVERIRSDARVALAAAA